MNITINRNLINSTLKFLEKNMLVVLLFVLTIVSYLSFLVYFDNGLGLAYNDARSHLDIGRRVVEGLKPGLAQLGSVWLPLTHVLMVPTIWNDFMWHSGLAGAIQSMVSFVATGLLVYIFLRELNIGILGRLVGVAVFAMNINVLYMQSTAMTELLLLATMTAGVYELLKWHKTDDFRRLILSSFWVMLSTLIRYDGWFLLAYSGGLVFLHLLKKKGFKAAEGTFIFFCTLGGFGIFLWFLWNLLIFKDPFYFAFGPFSAYSQQLQLEQANVLATKSNILLSLKIYFYALAYNTGAFTMILGFLGALVLLIDKKVSGSVKIASTALFAPFLFNVLALYMGHSVLFVQGISGDTWFNVRYGLMMMPSIAVFVGYLVHRAGKLRYTIIGLFLFVTFFAFANSDAVTLDDARVGSSQKNVTEVSSWLNRHTKDKEGFVLISVASHDAIIFSSKLPMAKFIHEGTGLYWDNATAYPDRWARWIIMRTNDKNDLTFKTVSKTKYQNKYNLVGSFPFADIYEIKPEYAGSLNTKPVLGKQR